MMLEIEKCGVTNIPLEVCSPLDLGDFCHHHVFPPRNLTFLGENHCQSVVSKIKLIEQQITILYYLFKLDRVYEFIGKLITEANLYK